MKINTLILIILTC